MKTFLQNLSERPFVTPAAILAIALLLGLFFIGYGLGNRNEGNTISVTGSAIQYVSADTASWRVDLARTVSESELASSYAILGKDSKTVFKFLNDQNLASSTVTQGVISTNPIYPSNGGVPTSYSVVESVTIDTSDVQKIDALSHDLGAVQGIVSGGTVVSPQAPAYFVSTLPELRISLAGKAIVDAKARAQEIAKSGGSVIGALRSASSGVVQVTTPNSTSADDYGSYDTSTIKKQVTVTTRANFYVK